MAGLLPDEGETLLANLLFKNITTDRGTGLELGLFTNSTISETTTAATLTEPSGGGYARIQLTDATWTVSGGTATYPLQTFVPTGTYTGAVYGYFVVTKGTTPRIIAIEVDTGGGVPRTLTNLTPYNVSLSIAVA